MVSEFSGGVRWALRRWPEVFVVSFLAALGCLVLALVLGETLHSVDVLRGGAELRNQQAVTFKPYYLEEGVSYHGDVPVDLAVDHIDGGSAYTTVEGENVKLPDSEVGYDYRVLVVFGDAVRDVFPELGLCHPAPCASAGYGVRNAVIPAFRYAGVELNVDHSLAENTTFFDPDVAGLRLDNYLVVHMPGESLTKIDDFGLEEALSKLVLIQPDPVEVDEYVEAVAEGRFILVPEDLAGEQPKRFDEILALSTSLILTSTAFLGLMFLAFTFSVISTMKRYRLAFSIRRAYGATTAHVAMRTFGYLAVTMLVLPIPGILLVAKFGGPFSSGALWVLAAVVAVFIGLWVGATRQAISNMNVGSI